MFATHIKDRCSNQSGDFGKSTSAKAVHSAKKHYSDFVAVVGKDIAPATLDKYYGLKYNNPDEFNKLKELYKGFSSGKLVRNANGQLIKVVTHTNLRAEPNSITQFVNKKGGIDRNYYDENGNQFKQISNKDHGHKKESSFGEHGEHGHDYVINKQGIQVHLPARELTPQERIENADIL